MVKPFLSDFLTYCKNLNLDQNSVKKIPRYIRQFDDYLQEQHLSELSHMTYKHGANFVSRDDPSPTTVKVRIRALNLCFNLVFLNSAFPSCLLLWERHVQNESRHHGQSRKLTCLIHFTG